MVQVKYEWNYNGSNSQDGEYALAEAIHQWWIYLDNNRSYFLDRISYNNKNINLKNNNIDSSYEFFLIYRSQNFKGIEGCMRANNDC